MDSRNYRGAALARLFQIVTLMYGGGRLTRRDFASVCECSERQIGRDLSALRMAGVPFDNDKKRGYYLEDNWSPLRLSLTLPEVVALLLARRTIAGSETTPFAHSAQTAFDKIAALLPSPLREQLEQDQSVAHYSGGKRNYADAPWTGLLSAIRTRAVQEMEYYTISTDTVSTRHVDPYHIVWVNGYCQLIAYCHKRLRVTNFALDGIHWIRSTGETFTIPRTFSLAEHLKGAAGPMFGEPIEIEVRFDTETARYARRRMWEFPHSLHEQEDGSLLMCATVRGLNDIRKELLAWGRHACALKPPALRDALREEACAITTLYSPAG